MNSRATLDVSELPKSTMDHRSPIWWGNVLLLVIETTMFAILIATYLYIRLVDFDQWPPPQVNRLPVIYHPVPDLLFGSINLVLLLGSCVPMYWVSCACLRKQDFIIKIGLSVCIAMATAATVLRFYEFPATHFRWDDNAYASIVWMILGMHLAHLITLTCENGVMAAWTFCKGLDDKHRRDIRVTATYWYWVAATWLVLYIVIYWVPRWF